MVGDTGGAEVDPLVTGDDRTQSIRHQACVLSFQKPDR